MICADCSGLDSGVVAIVAPLAPPSHVRRHEGKPGPYPCTHVSARIAIIGAGSAVFTRNLCSDILLAGPLRDSVIALMDVDPVRLEGARALVQELIDAR